MAVTRQIPIIKSIKATHFFPKKKIKKHKITPDMQKEFKVRNEHLWITAKVTHCSLNISGGRRVKTNHCTCDIQELRRHVSFSMLGNMLSP